jgi:hypothetical protein
MTVFEQEKNIRASDHLATAIDKCGIVSINTETPSLLLLIQPRPGKCAFPFVQASRSHTLRQLQWALSLEILLQGDVASLPNHLRNAGFLIFSSSALKMKVTRPSPRNVISHTDYTTRQHM